VDIAIPTDSYVRAAGPGRVLRVGEDPFYGFFVVLEHEDGYQTVYGHNSTILVVRGQTVRRNQVIALSGSTGRSTAPHLHFEILLDGLPVDPLSIVEQPG
jgi:murein DD-endopeptidase MepM/ murein hydrolase activator NlpD